MKIQHSLRIALLLVLATSFAAGSSPITAQADGFDDDNYDDLAIGTPAEDVQTLSNAGMVNVLFGGAAGITDTDQLFPQTLVGGFDSAEELDFFGSALAIGDFNCDGIHDLAVGTPSEDVDTTMNAGVVHVIHGESWGLNPLTNSQYWYQGYNGLGGSPEFIDNFGAALAAGDFDGDGCDDLAIGIPNQGVGSPAQSAAGAVQVLYGEPGTGLSGATDEYWHQNQLDTTDISEAADHFGLKLAAGDFNGDGYDDLAVGVPGEDIETANPDIIDGGAVDIIKGSASGLVSTGALHAWGTGLSGDSMVEDGDAFGSVLAVGNFDWDLYDDLAVGIPSEDISGAVSAGAVSVIFGTPTGLSPLFDSQFFTRASFGSETPNASDNLGWALAAGDFNGDYRDDLAVGFPDFDFGIDNIGQTRVIYGSASGLSTSGWDSIVQGIAGIGGVPEANDRLGYSLAAGNFNNDAYVDIAIGVPYEDHDGASPQTVDAGAVHIVYGSNDGVTSAGTQYLYQGLGEIGDSPESEDRYGEVLAAVPTPVDRIFLPLAIKQ